MDKHFIINQNIMHANRNLEMAAQELKHWESQRDTAMDWIEAKKDSIAFWKEEVKKLSKLLSE